MCQNRQHENSQYQEFEPGSQDDQSTYSQNLDAPGKRDDSNIRLFLFFQDFVTKKLKNPRYLLQ